MNLNSDCDNDHPHSASPVLLFDGLRRGRIVRQAERLIGLLYPKLTCHDFLFYCSLGDYRDDLDVLLRVHSSPVSALGIQGGPCSNHNRNCQGTVFFFRGVRPISLNFLVCCVTFRTSFLPAAESSRPP